MINQMIGLIGKCFSKVNTKAYLLLHVGVTETPQTRHWKLIPRTFEPGKLVINN